MFTLVGKYVKKVFADKNSLERDSQRRSSHPGEIRRVCDDQIEDIREQIKIKKENELKVPGKVVKKFLKEDFEQIIEDLEKTSSSNETMLVANPGHTPYSFTSKTNFTGTPQSITKKSGETTASTSQSSLSALPIPSASHIVENLKSLSVRLNRSTQIIKETVQRVLLPKPSSQLSVAESGASCSAIVVAPTNAHRSPRKNTASTDSLNIEMCHFKPIRPVPKTPNKKPTLLRCPKAIRVDAVDLKQNLIQSPKKSAVSDLFLVSRSSVFYHVKPNACGNPSNYSKPSSTSLSSHTDTNCTIMNNHLLSPEEVRKFLKQKQPVVRLKRCKFASSQDNTIKKTGKNSKTSSKNNSKRKPPPKRQLNGRVTNTKNTRSSVHKCTPKDPVTDPFVSKASVQNAVKERKKSRQNIAEEKLDFEFSSREDEPLSKRTRRGRGAPYSVATPIERNLRRRTRKQN